MVVGRGSFIEAFPLFGLDLDDDDSLFAEKLDLLLNFPGYARAFTTNVKERGVRSPVPSSRLSSRRTARCSSARPTRLPRRSSDTVKLWAASRASRS